MPSPEYMDDQPDLKWPMRGILCDWLIEVHSKFHLLPETLFLTINLVDRFLSKRVVSLNKLQLVGITAMLVAAKYEEIMAPSVQNFVYMSDGGYTEEEVLGAERYLLSTIDYNLNYPNPMNFLRRISKADDYDLPSRTVAKYFLEVQLVDHQFLKFPSSLIASASLWMARKMLDRGPWNANLRHYSGYNEKQILPVARLLHEYVASTKIQHEGLYKKYSSKKFMKASTCARDWATKRVRSLEAI